MPKSVKNALQNSFLQTLGAFGITGLNFLLMIGYAGFLEPAEYGQLVTAQAQVLVWLAFVDLGLTHSLVGALTLAEGSNDFRARDLVWRVILLRCSGALLGVAGVVVLAWINFGFSSQGEQLFWQMLAFTPHLFAIAIRDTASAYCLFRGRQGLSVLANFIGTSVTVALPLYLAWQDEPITVLLLSQSWGGLLAGAIVLTAFLISPTQPDTRRARFSTIKRRGPWSKEAWRALFRDAWPYAITFAATLLWQRLDQIVASNWLGYDTGGHYALSVRLAAVPLVFFTAVYTAIFPDLQRAGRDNPDQVVVYLGAFTKFIYRYGILIGGLILLVLGGAIFPFFPKYRPAFSLLPWFLPGIWAIGLHSIMINGLFGLRRYKDVVKSYLSALAVYLLLLIPLAEWWGLIGVAWASNAFSISLFYFAYRRAKAKRVLPAGYRLSDTYDRKERALLRSVSRRLRQLVRPGA